MPWPVFKTRRGFPDDRPAAASATALACSLTCFAVAAHVAWNISSGMRRGARFGMAAQAYFTQHLKSSLIIGGGVVTVSTVLAVMSGYAFGVLGVVGERWLFPLVSMPRMNWRWKVAHTGLGVSSGAFWMRAAFPTLPTALTEWAAVRE
ncbi:hypothetical protein [Streptomyces sp. NPDC058695]|uniref:hypothetical protein n=1 Tax=Streptomyces sp. NPDC058695 TaxID=3346604 RepID=UPI00365B0688